mmetsp:Transcript_21153/g.27245  ORF Transcript_21153/g.27245 Transcript_21153/m.27245 type:complete len:299 (+) Transcript_21153:52-948(+)
MMVNRVAIAQLCSTSNKLSNLQQISHCASIAKEAGASLLCLPECFGFMADAKHRTVDHAEILNDEDETAASSVLFRGLQDIAREYGLWISGGGIHEAGAPAHAPSGTSRVYNTHIVMDDAGSVVATYRKVHLFDVSVPEKNVNLKESASTAPGDCGVVVCDSPVGRLGLTTCYDVRFPEQFIKMRELGAQVLLVPSAFTVPTGDAHWHVLLRARAIEQQCYLLAAAQVGKHNEKRTSYGHSLAVDPWGKVLVDAGGNDENSQSLVPSIVTCEIDLNYLDSVRKNMPIDLHRSQAEPYL